ncbi:serine/threonine-protein kinase MARK2-like [Delphinapterus leucas]|uniref:Serine/threonine-protein kinase MARK2-like n=1 Tax=Delphinapterus leucas TaxID=9749 RepID=A0A2Y9MRW6_DELLE|nr:serine/threonine-protein kinase MARK2-like [Delphinapterus leucas]
MFQYLLLGYKRSEPEGYRVTLKPQPSADLSAALLPRPQERHRVPASRKQHIPTSNCCSENTPPGRNADVEEDQGAGRRPQHSTSGRGRRPPLPPTSSALSTGTNQSRNPPRWERASLGQASVRNGHGSLTVRVRGPLGFGFGHSLTRPRLHQESKCSPRGPPGPAPRRVPVRSPSPAQPPPVPESTRLPAVSVGSGAPALSKGNFAHRGSPTGARPRRSALR